MGEKEKQGLPESLGALMGSGREEVEASFWYAVSTHGSDCADC